MNRKISCYKELKCSKCNKIFNKKDNYNKHIKRKNSCINNLNKELTLTKYDLKVKILENEILIYKNNMNLLEDKIKKLENELSFCKSLLKQNGGNNINNINNSDINIGNKNNITNIIFNINVDYSHVDVKKLKEIIEQSVESIKNKSTKLIFNDNKFGDLASHPQYQTCIQLLSSLIKYIWKDVPENNIIKYFNETFVKYSKKKLWKEISEKEMLQYIIETLFEIYNQKDKELVKDKYMKNIWGQCSTLEQYQLFKNYCLEAGMVEQMKKDLSI
jgi:uncharacterized C2H2 Zn-finger protein